MKKENYKQNTDKQKLEIIPKIEKYTQYMVETIMKLPRTEKFNIGNEYKNSMYKTISNLMYLNKIKENNSCLYCLNCIDAEINTQRIYLRIMHKNKWIDDKKLNVAMGQIYEIGKITRRIS